MLHTKKLFSNTKCIYVKLKYGNCSIIFDGYGNGPSTKDHEHKRRSQKSKPCPIITVLENIPAYGSQHTFLSNDANKNQFVKLLTRYLILDGHHVEISTGDADKSIVAHALTKMQSTDSTVVVVADDTDVFIMLLHFFKKDQKPIMMLREPKGKHEERRLYNIKEGAASLKQVVLSNILAIHAWGGSDTTSAPYGIGKAAVVKLAQRSQEAQELMTVLSDENASRKDIKYSGIKLAVLMYGGENDEALSSLRFSRFMKMAASSSKLLPEKLPPTERAVVYEVSVTMFLFLCDLGHLIIINKCTNDGVSRKAFTLKYIK